MLPCIDTGQHEKGINFIELNNTVPSPLGKAVNSQTKTMKKNQTYVGVDKDINGGMTTIGKLIRDAKVFGLLDDAETCEGWNLAGIDALLNKVNNEWDKYGCLVSNLPEELFKRHQEIHDKAMEAARAAGWSGNQETDDEI